MATRYSMQRRLRMNRPSLRLRSKPPKLRTQRGMDFTAANLVEPLAMQHCQSCRHINYPPREICGECLSDQLIWRKVPTEGVLLQSISLHHSLWEFFKRRLQRGSWPIASVRLQAGPIVFAHVAGQCFGGDAAAGARVNVFSHSDSSRQAVLIVVPVSTPIDTPAQRRAIVEPMGLLEPAVRGEQYE